MNIVDKLTGTKDKKLGRVERSRRDVLFTRLRVSTGLPEENIDLSGVDFFKSDEELRNEIAAERGITSEKAIEAIDLDEIIIPSGAYLRRAVRHHGRRVAKARRVGQKAYRKQVREARHKEPRLGNHDRKVAAREAAAKLAELQKAGA